MKITETKNCGNSPKQQLLRRLNISFAKGDYETLVAFAADDIEWEIKGDKTIRGKSHFMDALKSMAGNNVRRLAIENFITHGAAGCVNGEMEMDNGSVYAFCDVYEFTSAAARKIRKMVSYVVAIK